MGAFSLLLVRKLQLEKIPGSFKLEKSPHESWFFRQRAVNHKKTKSQHKKSDSAPIAVWDCMWLHLTAKQIGMLTQLLGLSSLFLLCLALLFLPGQMHRDCHYRKRQISKMHRTRQHGISRLVWQVFLAAGCSLFPSKCLHRSHCISLKIRRREKWWEKIKK